MIAFVSNYQDLSTDRGYQFKFFCDKCGNGFLSAYQASTLGTAASLLEAAGSFFGGSLGRAGETVFSVQRAIGGSAHDSAIQAAVEEGKAQFHQCPRCAKWVCPEVCWNGPVGLCHNCAPNVQTELAVAQTGATIEQINSHVRQQNMTEGMDLKTPQTAVAPTCVQCHAAMPPGAKFCGECGTPVAKAQLNCTSCGTLLHGAKFCPECGHAAGK
jgi:hypothetical protein